MTATTFDTLTAARDLEAAGAGRAELATKADLDAKLTDLCIETKADLQREIGTLRSEMRWMFAFQGVLILAIAAKLFGFV